VSRFNLCGPAWWCEPCQMWWPGSWAISIGESFGPDVNTEPYDNRTCAECGAALTPKLRPLRRMEPS
jgi:hypothetical protein